MHFSECCIHNRLPKCKQQWPLSDTSVRAVCSFIHLKTKQTNKLKKTNKTNEANIMSIKNQKKKNQKKRTKNKKRTNLIQDNKRIIYCLDALTV